MQRQTAQQGQGLAGTERYGTVHSTEVRQLIPAHQQPGVQPAPPSGVKFGIKDQCTFIKMDGEKCMAPRKKTSDFCVGHTRQIAKKQQAEQKEEAQEVQE